MWFPFVVFFWCFVVLLYFGAGYIMGYEGGGRYIASIVAIISVNITKNVSSYINNICERPNSYYYSRPASMY